jgi:hypothetical protein
MGLREAKAALVAALRAGAYEHEVREAQSEKNLLAVGDVSADEVIQVVSRARGADYSESPHHWDASVAVHLFQPHVGGRRWYVKAYFLEQPDRVAVFISVHYQVGQ